MDTLFTGVSNTQAAVDDAGNESTQVYLPPLQLVCEYDLDNLKWSGKAIMQSISLELWETIKKDLDCNPSGPEAFAAVVYKLQEVNLDAVCLLIEEIQALKLINEPGQDVNIFGGQVIELCRRISSTGFAPDDIGVLAATCFLKCDVLAFKLKSIWIHYQADINKRVAMGWYKVVRFKKKKYLALSGQKLWTPQTQKPKDDSLSGLHAKLNNLTPFAPVFSTPMQPSMPP